MSVQYKTHGTSLVLIICSEFSIQIYYASRRKQKRRPTRTKYCGHLRILEAGVAIAHISRIRLVSLAIGLIGN